MQNSFKRDTLEQMASVMGIIPAFSNRLPHSLSERYYYRSSAIYHNCPAFRRRPRISVCHITYIANPAASTSTSLKYSICTGSNILKETPIQVSDINHGFIRVQEPTICILPRVAGVNPQPITLMWCVICLYILDQLPGVLCHLLSFSIVGNAWPNPDPRASPER